MKGVVRIARKRGTLSIDVLLAGALAGGATQVDAAARVGVSPRTVRRRLEDPEFVSQVERLRAQAAEKVLQALSDAIVGAVATLAELSQPPAPPPVRLAASRALLDQHLRYSQAVDLERRLRALEARDDAIDVHGG